MKILQINTVCGVGSTGRIVVDLYRSLSDLGSSGMIAYGRGNAPDDINSYKIGTKMSVRAAALKARILGDSVNPASVTTRRLTEKICEYNPDIVHLHNIHGYYINCKILFDYLKKLNKPVVWTFHDVWPLTGHCARTLISSCLRYETGCFSCPSKKLYPKSMFFDTSKRAYAQKKEIFNLVPNMHIVTPSEWLLSCVENSFLSSFPASVIHNGIDRTVFTPTASDFKQKHNIKDKFMILAVSNGWDKIKGYDILLSLANLLPEYYHIVIVGLSEKQKAALPDNVTGVLKTADVKELAAIYSAADVFINPSRDDNFPSVNIEALSCGTPLVCSDAGGTSEALDKTCGISVKCGDVGAFFEAIEKVRENNFSKEACMARAEMFDKSVMAEKYNRLYQSLVE